MEHSNLIVKILWKDKIFFSGKFKKAKFLVSRLQKEEKIPLVPVAFSV